MSKLTKKVLFWFAFLLATWDAVTTYQGLDKLIGGGWFLPGALMLVINGIVAFTYVDFGEDSIKSFAAVIWFVALGTDFATSWVGNMELFFVDQNIIHVSIGLATAIFTSASTIFVSYFLFKQKVLDDIFGA